MEFKNPDLKQEINFTGRPDRNDGATMLFIMKKLEETIFEFSQNAATMV